MPDALALLRISLPPSRLLPSLFPPPFRSLPLEPSPPIASCPSPPPVTGAQPGHGLVPHSASDRDHNGRKTKTPTPPPSNPSDFDSIRLWCLQRREWRTATAWRRRGPVEAHRLRHHNRAILVKADQSAARRLREKATEAEREARHGPSWRSGWRASAARRQPGRPRLSPSRPPRSPCMRSCSRPWSRRERRSRSSPPPRATPARRSHRRRRSWTLAASGRRQTTRA